MSSILTMVGSGGNIQILDVPTLKSAIVYSQRKLTRVLRFCPYSERFGQDADMLM